MHNYKTHFLTEIKISSRTSSGIYTDHCVNKMSVEHSIILHLDQGYTNCFEINET